MNVLILNSSPRKDGNSDVLCQRFAEGAAEAGHQVEKIDLRNQKLSPCMACYACMKDHICAITDDMAGIFARMQQADVIVLSSPVYFYSMSAQIKTVIDRCLVDHKSLKGKRFYYIVTAADPQHEAADAAIAGFRGFLRCLPDAVEAGIVYGTGTWDKGDAYKHPAFEQAYQMGKEV